MLIEMHGSRRLQLVEWIALFAVLLFSTFSFAEQPATQPAGPIKVGITFSKLTGVTNGPSGNAWGYDKQARPARELVGKELEFYPIIEAGSDKDEKFAAELKRYFPDRKPLVTTETEEIKKLHVIVACECWMGTDDMLKALHEAVSNGVGFLNMGGIGWATPGFRGEDQRTTQLAGLEEAQGGHTDNPAQCEVIFNHAILGNLKQGQILQMRPLGAFGILPADMQPLVKISDMSQVKTRGPAVNNPDYVFYPIYISHLEKGKIVGMHFGIGIMPKAERDDLMLRAIRYLAGRKIE